MGVTSRGKRSPGSNKKKKEAAGNGRTRPRKGRSAIKAEPNEETPPFMFSFQGVRALGKGRKRGPKNV